MNEIFLYQHGWAGNHGCEAFVRSVIKIMDKKINIISFRPNDDKKYGIDKIADNLLISIGGDLYCGKDTTLLSIINKKIHGTINQFLIVYFQV